METNSAINTNDVNTDLMVQKLTPEQKSKLDAMVSQIDMNDSQTVLSYGSGSQSNLSNFANTALDNIRNKDTGYVGEMLTNLMVKVKEVDVDNLGNGKGILSKIPLFSGLLNSAKKFMARYEKLSVEIDKIVDELDKAQMQLMRDVKMFDMLYGKNIDYLKELDILILAGTLKLREVREKVLPELKNKAEVSNDPIDAQAYNDMQQKVLNFERKIDDLRRTRMIAIQNAPQIRLIQGSDEALVQKIQSSIVNTIPLWKNQIVSSIGLLRQKKIIELQRSVTDTTNQLLLKNSEMLKQGTIDIAKENERGNVDIETLKKVNIDLISTIEETIRIQEDGKTKRAQAELDMQQMEQELKDKLTSIRK